VDIEEIGIGAKNWFYSAQDRDYWRALSNVALNLRVSYTMVLVIYTNNSKNANYYWLTLWQNRP
jgi:hypothetical protein